MKFRGFSSIWLLYFIINCSYWARKADFKLRNRYGKDRKYFSGCYKNYHFFSCCSRIVIDQVLWNVLWQFECWFVMYICTIVRNISAGSLCQHAWRYDNQYITVPDFNNWHLARLDHQLRGGFLSGVSDGVVCHFSSSLVSRLHVGNYYWRTVRRYWVWNSFLIDCYGVRCRTYGAIKLKGSCK